MSRVSELIDLIVQNKNAEASEVLNQELMNRSYEGINELKPQVANDYFASVIDMPNTGEPLEYHNETEQESTDETD
jgi:hypothetical protein